MNARKTTTIGNSGGRAALINARLLDPASGRDEAGGILIEDGLIADLGPHLRRSAPRDAAVINCEDRLVIPGLVDMQVYTGEPGLEHRETLASASRAAAAGGVTTMIVMPATDPVIDDMALVDFVNRRANDTAIVRVHTMAALTKGLNGTEMSEIGLLKLAGAVAFSNGRQSIASAKVMRRVLAYAKDFDALVVHHTEDDDLAGAGVVNEGEVSARLGLPGIPKAAEIIMIERDIRLAELSGGRYHAAQISCRESLDAIRAAKRRKLPVTCGVSINHLTLNENDIGSYRTFHKMRPPLRSEDDRRSLVEGVADGSIDVIVSSHDPQGTDGKRRPFAEAADGAVGLETLLPAALRLVHSGDVKLVDLFAALTIRPAALLGLPVGKLEKGAPADLAVVDLGAPWMLDRDTLHSKAKNSPFDEAKFQGRVMRTLVAGETVFPFAN
ncbi:MAG: dihydroorotase [Hyphomicrobiaceae bacterium]